MFNFSHTNLCISTENDFFQNSSNNGGITTNWKLKNFAKNFQIHFNVKKLETVLDYNSNDKDATKLWKLLNDKDQFTKYKINKLFLSINDYNYVLSDFMLKLEDVTVALACGKFNETEIRDILNRILDLEEFTEEQKLTILVSMELYQKDNFKDSTN